jgi:hypothetical protein
MSALAVGEGPFAFGVAAVGGGPVGLKPFGAGSWYTGGEVEATAEAGLHGGPMKRRRQRLRAEDSSQYPLAIRPKYRVDAGIPCDRRGMRLL